jgi:DNA excision repair protein ERCC-2
MVLSASLSGTAWQLCVADVILTRPCSYEYLESAVTTWCDQGIMDEIQARKLVFVETQDGAETSIALDNFQKVLP